MRAGYTHLIGGAKNDAGLMARLDARVKRDYPEHYVRCLECVDEIEGIPPA